MPKRLPSGFCVFLVLVSVLWGSPRVHAQSEFETADAAVQPHAFHHVGLSMLRQIEPGLNGSGVALAVVCRSYTYLDGVPQNDYQPYAEHNCLTTADMTFFDDGRIPANVSPHSTAVCSILLGLDPFAGHAEIGDFPYYGAAPAARAHIYELWHFVKNNVFTQNAPDARILSASFGIETDDWWTRGIEALAEHEGLIVVAGIGNGGNAFDPPLYPGASANAIGVGVVNSVATEDLATRLANFALAYPENSSCGPTISRQCKPDLVAPGNCLAAQPAGPDVYEPTGDWSSYATPMVAGTAALLVQKAGQDPALYPAAASEGGNCTIKAILLNSATKLPFWHKGTLSTDDDHEAPLDYVQGAGMLDAFAAYMHLIAGRWQPGQVHPTGWDNNVVDVERDAQNTYTLVVEQPADKTITATVNWNRHYARKYPFKALPQKDADLRLEIWAIDENDPDASYLLDYSDSRVDNVEHICAHLDPDYTKYEVVVARNDGSEDAQAEPQRYGLAWNVSTGKNASSIHWYDINADGVVNQKDLAILIGYCANGGPSQGDYAIGDVNADGLINVDDVHVLIEHANLRAEWHSEEPAQQ